MSVVFSFVREANGNITCIPCSQPGGSDGKESACKAGDLGLTPGSGRCPGEGNGNPLQDSCLENSMDRGAWLAAVLGVAKSQIQLSDRHFHFHVANKRSSIILHWKKIWRVAIRGRIRL